MKESGQKYVMEKGIHRVEPWRIVGFSGVNLAVNLNYVHVLLFKWICGYGCYFCFQFLDRYEIVGRGDRPYGGICG